MMLLLTVFSRACGLTASLRTAAGLAICGVLIARDLASALIVMVC